MEKVLAVKSQEGTRVKLSLDIIDYTSNDYTSGATRKERRR